MLGSGYAGGGLSSRGKEAARLPFRDQVICGSRASLAICCGRGAGLGGRLGEASARLLDLLTGGLADLVEANREGFLNLSVAEELDLVTGAVNKTHLAEGFLIDDSTGFEAVIKVADVDDDEHIAEVEVIEATLGQAAVKRHLATFETDACAAAGTGFLTLVAFARGFTEAGAFAGAKAFRAVFRAGVRLEIVEFHFLDLVGSAGSIGSGGSVGLDCLFLLLLAAGS